MPYFLILHVIDLFHHHRKKVDKSPRGAHFAVTTATELKSLLKASAFNSFRSVELSVAKKREAFEENENNENVLPARKVRKVFQVLF